MTKSRVTPAATSDETSEDDSPLYRQWTEEEWWPLYGEKFDAASIALGHKPDLIRQPGKPNRYAFEIDPEATKWFLFEVYKAKRASSAGIADDDPISFALGLPCRPTPLGGPSPGNADEMFAEIESEDPEPQLVEWDVPEQHLGGIVMVRSREFVDWADRVRYPVPPVIVEGVRAKFQRLDAPASSTCQSVPKQAAWQETARKYATEIYERNRKADATPSKTDLVADDNYLERRVASPKNVTRR